MNYVYFIQADDDGPIKIGTAKDVAKRMRNMVGHNHHKLNLIGLISRNETCNGSRNHSRRSVNCGGLGCGCCFGRRRADWRMVSVGSKRIEAPMRLKISEVRGAQHPEELLVAVACADGKRAYLYTWRRAIDRGSIEVGYPVGRSAGQFLVELPAETVTGAWRVWVKDDQLLEDAKAE